MNLTFAACKNSKDTLALKQQFNKKYELAPTSFKATYEQKDKLSAHKKLDNQQNHLINTQHPPFPRKNMVKVDKSNKKYPKVFKSPVHKTWQPQQSQSQPTTATKLPLQSIPQSNKPVQNSMTYRPLQQSNYCHNFPPRPSHKAEQIPGMLTPSLNKNNRSALDDQFGTSLMNHSFLTQKHSLNNSQEGSISSNKNSFNDSFQLYATNGSIDQENSRQFADHVNNSIQLVKQNHQFVRQFPKQQQLRKHMKKSSHFYYNNSESILKQLDAQSNHSVTNSISSIKFSQKFKHYKKKQNGMISPTKKIGFALRDFQRIKVIGSGKYGKVQLVRHARTGFICALKSVSKQMIKDQKLQQTFMQQIKIQLYLNHPNIVQLYGFFHDQTNIYLLMEYCSGGHLYKLIRQVKKFTQPEILLILSNIYQAVSYIHCNGIIHRDIKPENIVIEHGMYKLCDFGWAAYACGDTRTTFCGTPLYVCPQVLKGEEYNEKADIWGLGIVTYELTFGRVPFPIMSQSDLLKIIKDPVYFPVWGQASELLVPLVKRMLSKEAQQRPSLNEILTSQIFRNFKDGPNPIFKSELEQLY